MKILFKVFPQKSHFNATFPFARALKAGGHEVIYAGLPQLRSHAEVQGFEYHLEEEDVFPYSEPRRDTPKLDFWSILKNWRSIHGSASAMRRKFARRDSFGKLIRATKPDLIFVDSPYTFFALSLYQHKIPFAILESMMNLDRAPGCPPMDTNYVPNGSRLSRFICELHWWRYFLKRAFYGLVGIRMDFNRRFVLETAAVFRLDRSALSFDRYFHLGLRTVPELILSPQPLDFPRRPHANQFYVGTPVDIDRQEVASDYHFRVRFAQVVAAREHGTPLVYCSLGTGNWRYKGAERFLHRVIRASSGKGWNLIVVIGTEFPLEQFGDLPANVHLFQVVPQLQVLRQCDLMITHGGMNSIAECVMLGVPMLVYPGTNEIDQAGNAARVVFHDAGLKGRLATETAATITGKVRTILDDARFKKQVEVLRAQLEAARVGPAGASALLERAFGRCAGAEAGRFDGQAGQTPAPGASEFLHATAGQH